MIDSKRPRHWAADIDGGIATIDQVPEAWRGQVETILDCGSQLRTWWAEHVLAGQTLQERRRRLARCPQGLQGRVQRMVRELWDERRTAA